jgi:hypothetical protein
VIDAIVMRALQPEVSARYQRAEDLLTDILQARREIVRRSPAAVSTPGGHEAPPPAGPRRPAAARLRTREVSGGRFCWRCRKPLPARGGRCPFCGESQ